MRKILSPVLLPVLMTLLGSACAEEASGENTLVHTAEKIEHGEGRAPDLVLASQLYCDAARAGNAEAAFRLGWMYFNGRGVERNDALAAGMFELAQERGYVFAHAPLQHLQAASPALPNCMAPPAIEVVTEEVRQPELDDALKRARPDQAELVRLVHEMAPAYGIDPRLAVSVMLVESNFSSNAKSPKGALGLMQLIPQTAERFNVKRPFDSRENIRGGLSYLRWLLAYYQGKMELVLAGYNAGEKAVDRYHGIPPYPETREYVKKVLTLYRKHQHAFDSSITPASLAFP
jgi:soluble lytic murein transglycosylase-like protein